MAFVKPLQWNQFFSTDKKLDMSIANVFITVLVYVGLTFAHLVHKAHDSAQVWTKRFGWVRQELVIPLALIEPFSVGLFESLIQGTLTAKQLIFMKVVRNICTGEGQPKSLELIVSNRRLTRSKHQRSVGRMPFISPVPFHGPFDVSIHTCVWTRMP